MKNKTNDKETTYKILNTGIDQDLSIVYYVCNKCNKCILLQY